MSSEGGGPDERATTRGAGGTDGTGDAAAPDADALVEALGLVRHPEGGWYAEVWRARPAPPEASPDGRGGRGSASAIYFLLREGESSAWHRVDAAEIWSFHAGSPLELAVSTDGRSVVRHRLGPDVASGSQPQVVVPAGAWQSARSLGPWTLVGCVVTPAFTFDGFELAPAGWEPGR
jgi:predicted cupin superfamily sugar epimerase